MAPKIPPDNIASTLRKTRKKSTKKMKKNQGMKPNNISETGKQTDKKLKT